MPIHIPSTTGTAGRRGFVGLLDSGRRRGTCSSSTASSSTASSSAAPLGLASGRAAVVMPVVARPSRAAAPFEQSALEQRLAMAAAASSSGRGESCGSDRGADALISAAAAAAATMAAATMAAAAHPRSARMRDVRAAASKDGKGGSSSGGGGKSSSGSGKSSGGGGSGKSSGGGKAKKGKSAADDKADPNKADFSAYWSLRFREFFSGRRGYLELARRRQEPPEAGQRVDAQIAEAGEKLDAATQAARDRKRAAFEAEALAEAAAVAEQLANDPAAAARLAAEAPTSRERIAADADAARRVLHSPAVKYAAIPALQLRALAAAIVRAPLTIPGAALAAWRRALSKQRYEAFLLAEGERVWYWRNRTENERWFWEVFLFDRLLIPVGFTLAYLYLVPDNLLWAVAVPLLALYWQDGRLPTPANLLWWVIMVFGLYGKCWHQVTAVAAALFRWA